MSPPGYPVLIPLLICRYPIPSSLSGVSRDRDGMAQSGIYPSPFKDFGYDVSDYKDIEPIFGTMEDFNNLLTDLHSRGQ